MNILVTGANGFLGHYLVEQLLTKGYTVIATAKGECRLPYLQNEKFIYETMDFSDPYSVHDVFEKHEPEVVVHAGAMSKPDECELDQWQAYVVNVESVLSLVINSEEYKSFFVFMSSDFVFDGETGPYRESDKPNPVNFYGKTKLQAEEAVQEYPFDWAIVRTVLVYGKPNAGRENILTVVKKKLVNKEVYNVFDDQLRTPTYVEDLAKGIVSIIEKRARGIFHISGEDQLSPYEMAVLTADHLGLDKTLLKKVTASEFSQPAKRPPKTVFILDKARRELDYEPISFSEGLRKTFEV